jgi:hypothetical protein
MGVDKAPQISPSLRGYDEFFPTYSYRPLLAAFTLLY